MRSTPLFLTAAAAVFFLASPAPADPIKIETVKRDAPVKFSEVKKILNQSCIACHNASAKEGGLILETRAAMIKGGGNGPAVAPGKSADSALLAFASHTAEPFMPPPKNKVNARNLTPQELGLIKLWIDQGAPAGTGDEGRQVDFQPLPEGVNPIYAAAISDDGQFAACGRANQIFIYHVPTGRLVCRLTDPEILKSGVYEKPGVAHLDLVQALAFSPDGTRLASGGYRNFKLWRRPANVQISKAAAAGGAQAAAASADGKWLAVGGTGKTIQLIDAATGKVAKTLTGHTAEVTALEFSADGAKLFSASADNSIRGWNVADGSPAGRIDSPVAVKALTLVGGGNQLATGGGDNFIRLWNAPTGATRQLAGLPQPATALTVSPDKKWIAAASSDGKVVLLELASGKVAKTLTGHAGAVNALSFNTASNRLASAGADKTVRVWDVAAGKEVASFTAGIAAVDAVALAPSGTQAVTAVGNSIGVWKLDAPAPKPMNGDNGSPATVAAVSYDGKLLATAAAAGGKPVVIVRDVASGNAVKTLAGHAGPITALAFSADNTRLASGSADKTARVWNLADGKELKKIEGFAQPVAGVALNSNGQQVVAAAGNVLKLYNVADGKELKNFVGHGGAIVGVAMTTNNQFVVSASADQTIRVWNPADGKQVRSLPHGTPAASLALSRDNSRLAAGGADNSVKVYQVADGKLLHTLKGHTAAVNSLAFSFDHTRLVSGGGDNQALVWQTADGQLVEITPVAGLAFAAYGPAANTILTGGGDKTIHLRTLRFERPLAGNAKRVTGLVYNSNGQFVYSSSEDGTVRGYQVSNGQQRFAANHAAPVHGLALSPNGQYLASAGENKLVRVWNASNGGNAPKPQFGEFKGPVKSVAFSADSTRVIGGSAEGQVLVYNLASGEAEQGFGEHTAGVSALAGVTGANNVQLVVSASADKSARIWPLSLVRSMAGHSKPVTSLDTLATANTQILSGSEDGTVKHWNTTNGQQVRTMSHGGPVAGVAVRPDGQRFASVSAIKTVKLWNAANGQQIAEMKGDFRIQDLVARLTTESTLATNETKNRTTIVANAKKAAPPKAEAAKKAATALAAADKSLKEKKAAADKANAAKTAAEKAVAAAATKVKAAETKVAQAAEALKKDAKNDGLKKAKAAADKELADAKKAQQTEDNKLKATAKPVADTTKALNDAQAAFNNAKRTSDQAAIDSKKAQDAIPVAEAELKVAQEDEKNVKAALEQAKKDSTASEQPLVSVAFSPDNLELAVGGADKLVHTYDATSGKGVDIFQGHAGPVQQVAYTSPTTLASGAADNTLVVWNTSPAWTLERVVNGDSSPLIDRVIALAFSPNGKLIAAGGGEPSRSGELKIFEVATGKLVREIPDAHSDTIFGLEFSPDGTLIASGAADKFVKVFKVADGKIQKSFEGHTHHVLGVSWQFDGRVLASCGADQVIKVWNAETGEQRRTITGFGKQFTGIKFVGSSNQIIASNGDGRVHRRRTDNGGNIRVFSGASDFLYACDVTYDGNILAAAGQDSVLRIYNAANGQVIRNFEAPKPPEPKDANKTAAK